MSGLVFEHTFSQLAGTLEAVVSTCEVDRMWNVTLVFLDLVHLDCKGRSVDVRG